MTPRLSLKSTSIRMSMRDFRLVGCRSKCGGYTFLPLSPLSPIFLFLLLGVFWEHFSRIAGARLHVLCGEESPFRALFRYQVERMAMVMN